MSSAMTSLPDDWFTDAEFWIATYPFMFPDTAFAAAAEDAAKVMALSGCAGGALLDLGCGPGRFVVPFAQAGFAVTGVDRTPFLLDKARAYAAAQQVSAEFVPEDMRAFVRPGAFDIAINLFTTFGYFADPKDNAKVLDNVFASLKPGGVFVLDTMGKEVLARVFAPAGAQTLDNGDALFQRRAVTRDWSLSESAWTLVQGERARTFHVRHWLYSGQEMRRMMLDAGFTRVDLYGNLDGEPYDVEARRLVAVARKR